MKQLLILGCIFFSSSLFAQSSTKDSSQVYRKKILDNAELEFLTSYYTQDGDNAAVSGGIGTEELTDFTPTIVLTMPIGLDDVLKLDLGLSAYSSASSSNVDPFDGSSDASPFQATSGASSSDLWYNLTGAYSHYSKDRNTILSANVSFANEYDYTSIGFGAGITKLFNEKNTELGLKASAYIDSWKIIYPVELRPFESDGNGINNKLFTQNTILGNTDYAPTFTELDGSGRNSYSIGGVFSQILSPKMQGSIAVDVVSQSGLLSTPFQRVYFSDVANSSIKDFQLADDIERLPDSRFKTAIGGRLNWYLTESLVLRSFYRFYNDDWGINSHTASIELPVKLGSNFTIYPSYRFYQQTAVDYFAPHEGHLSSDEFYTSDYDLSDFTANQYGFGINYTDIFTKLHVRKLGLKSIDFKYSYYKRNTGLASHLFSIGFKIVRDN